MAWRELIPTPELALLGGLAGISTWFVAAGAARVAFRWKWRTGDSRKLFHFLIFSTAAGLRAFAPIGAVSAFGTVIVLGVLSAVRRGSGDPLFEALARPEDEPHRGGHVLMPLFATALGGVLAHLIAGEAALVALLVSGWGDAVGEPVGIRWGRHRYRVPSLRGVRAERSWEGSAAVGLASALAAAVGLLLLRIDLRTLLIGAGLLALITTAVEAISPHGWDNLTVLVAAAIVVRLWLG